MKETQQYLDFVDKFKAKKTTDDCYTPDNVMQTIISWVGENLQPLEGLNILRPFYPDEIGRASCRERV